MDLRELPTALRDFGLRVVETDGWLTRGYDTVSWVGQLTHHTAISGHISDTTAAGMIKGRGGEHPLAGPLCNSHEGVAADGTYVVYLIAGRRARHAGPGSPTVLEEVLHDRHVEKTAAERGLQDSENAHGNRSLFGREVQHNGTTDPWTDELLDGIGRSSAAVCQLFGWSPNRHKGHKHWTSRKIDPSWPGSLPGLTTRYLEDFVDKETFLAWFTEAMNKGATTPGSHGWADSVDDQSAKINSIIKSLRALDDKVDKLAEDVAKLQKH